MMYLIEKALDAVFDSVKDSIKKEIEPYQLKKMMVNSIDYVKKEHFKNVEINGGYKEAINNINAELIAPNLTIEELSENIKPCLNNLIKSMSEKEKDEFLYGVCLHYKLESAEHITISYVDNDIHSTHDNLVYRDSMESPLHFLEELNDCMQYEYIHLILGKDDEEFFKELGDEIAAECEYIKEGKSEPRYKGLSEVFYNFPEPVLQCDLREKLAYINERCRKEGYGIVSIRSNK